jgi:MoaA/NifB/PqqE/SkfB family radical SAM enzyme
MHYSIDLNYNCNNKCLFCFNLFDKSKKYKIERAKKEIDKAKLDNFNYLDFYGGEPLLYKQDLIAVLKYANEKKLKSGIATNATLLDAELVKEFNCLGVINCRTTLHGHTKFLHELVTQRKNSYCQTINGIKLLLKHFKGEIIINIVITKLNYKYLDQIVNFIMRLDTNKKAAIKLSNLIFNGNLTVYRKLAMPLTILQPILYKVVKNLEKEDMKFFIEKFPKCILISYADRFIKEEDLDKELVWSEPCNYCLHKKDNCVGFTKNYFNYIRKEPNEVEILNKFNNE